MRKEKGVEEDGRGREGGKRRGSRRKQKEKRRGLDQGDGGAGRRK